MERQVAHDGTRFAVAGWHCRAINAAQKLPLLKQIKQHFHRSLLLRAGGTSASHGPSALVDVDRDARAAGANRFSDATTQLIGNFDAALTSFQEDVKHNRANVRVDSCDNNGSAGGGAVSSA